MSQPDQTELTPESPRTFGASRKRASVWSSSRTSPASVEGYTSIGNGRPGIHERISGLLAVQGVWLDGIVVCPHTPDARCECRKPRPGSGPAAGRGTGARTILVRTRHRRQYEGEGIRADLIVDDLLAASHSRASEVRCTSWIVSSATRCWGSEALPKRPAFSLRFAESVRPPGRVCYMQADNLQDAPRRVT